jgi:hypothetical protein
MTFSASGNGTNVCCSRIGLDYSTARSERNESRQLIVLIQIQSTQKPTEPVISFKKVNSANLPPINLKFVVYLPKRIFKFGCGGLLLEERRFYRTLDASIEFIADQTWT